MFRKNSRFLTLLQMRLAMRRLLPVARWSLTPPFHPYQACAWRFAFCCAVCRRTVLAVFPPVVIRHFFRRSPDFASPTKDVIINWRRGYISSAIKTYSSDSSSESSTSSSSSSSSMSSSLTSSSLSETLSSSSSWSSTWSSSSESARLPTSIVK